MPVGIDLGGTKIEAAALGEDGDFLARQRVPNPRTYGEALTAVRNLVLQIEEQAGGRGRLGVGSPGSPSPRSGVIRNANSTWLNGRPFREDLQRVLDRPVRLANDANCLAVSEAADGAAAGDRIVFGVIIGTGCGGGLVVNGRLIEGANGIAGEWGHVPLPWASASESPGPACWCGQRGCLETWLSGTGLARDYAETTGRRLISEEIIAAARAGEPEASTTFDLYIDRLGRALAMLCNLFDPDAIVFGGGLSNVQEIYARRPTVIARYVFSDVWEAKLTPARWGDSSGVRGAARLWDANEQA